MASVVLRDVTKRYGDFQALHGASLHIEEGEFVVFVGPSGCGKSTLLRMIAGLESITSGEILIGGERVNETPARHRGISMVFQNYALYPHMTVAENMGFGLKNIGTPKAEIDARVAEAARILQIEALLDRKPREMSGGQRQRVAIGRAIVRKPKAFLFDEPLSNLDAALRVQMRTELARLHQTIGATMIYVTHDQVEAMTMADRIVVMREGHIEQVGAPLDLYRNPKNLFVAGFLGSPKMNFLEGRIGEVGEGRVLVDVGHGAPLSVPVSSRIDPGPVTVGIRPEHLKLAANGSGVLTGRVDVVEQLGNSTLIYVDLGGRAQVVAEESGDCPAHVGETVRLAVAPAAAHLFDGRGDVIPRSVP
ncbi:sn-glycerol-3-phosphate ABC transporter ATP-binding protein UgpC [Chelativorans sp.]|uniref:ABC transporter ATP-binding protein n=1 Tax=Chelativorans sp. TaxID=2203393 RepID=UPI0028111E7A|nr:sn-glycerol-3-phosphate ABC transporter ATP-binding protein UgpC [Chelativorans sp.]